MSERFADRASGNDVSHHGSIKVLMYHRVVTTVSSLTTRERQICITAQTFERQLEFLDRWGFTPITFSDYRLSLEGNLNLPKKPVIITFDDGYLDTFEVAYPILRKCGMKCVVFVLGDRKIRTNFWDAQDGSSAAPLMSDQQILELHSAGFEIGSHSLRHERLPSLTRESGWDAISRSRMVLEIVLNSPVHTFAYPYGLLDQKVKEMVKDAGYILGCAVYTGPATFCRDPFEIRRIEIGGSIGALGYAARLLLPYQYYALVRWRAGNLTRRFGHRGDTVPGPMQIQIDSDIRSAI
jgi:peptidoglycan/xylan/chitin deacetylase (PgdA/CDA1 family)